MRQALTGICSIGTHIFSAVVAKPSCEKRIDSTSCVERSQNIRDLQAEIEKVKRRREEREAERARQEEELSMLQRERAAMEARELESKEEHFHLEQVGSSQMSPAHLGIAGLEKSLNGSIHAGRTSINSLFGNLKTCMQRLHIVACLDGM